MPSRPRWPIQLDFLERLEDEVVVRRWVVDGDERLAVDAQHRVKLMGLVSAGLHPPVGNVEDVILRVCRSRDVQPLNFPGFKKNRTKFSSILMRSG